MKLPESMIPRIGKDGLMFWPEGTLFPGELNISLVLQNPSGGLYVWRFPRSNPSVLPAINEEFFQTGFIDTGGSYRFRSIPEQAVFMDTTHRAGLKTLPVVYTNGKGILSTFVKGMPFDVYLDKGHIFAVTRVLDNLFLAHQSDIVFGDRWVKNTIITPNGDVVEIDFDIYLQGDYAKEYEFAQTLYHMFHFSSDRDSLFECLREHLLNREIRKIYKLPAVIYFLKKFYEHFQDTAYEKMPDNHLHNVRNLIVFMEELMEAE